MNWLENLYPQGMANSLTEQDRAMMINRALMGMGTGMLSGADKGMSNAGALGLGVQGGIGSLDQMMSGILQNKMNTQKMDMYERGINLDEKQYKLRKDKHDAEMKAYGAKPVIKVFDGIPFSGYELKDGTQLGWQPLNQELAFLYQQNQQPTNPTPEGGSGGDWRHKLGAGVYNMTKDWSLPKPKQQPTGEPSGPPTPRMKANFGQPMQMGDIMTMMGATKPTPTPKTGGKPSALDGAFKYIPQEARKGWVYSNKHRLNEEDKKILIGMGLL